MQLTATVPFDADSLTRKPTALRVDLTNNTNAAILFGTELFPTMQAACTYAARMMNDGYGVMIVDTIENVYIDLENYEQYA